MEARVNILCHGQSAKDFLKDVIRGWLVLQRSGLSDSSKKTVLGSTENTLGRWRIVEALKNSGQIMSFSGIRWNASETVVERWVRTSKEKQTSGSPRCI